jgi:Cys-tRNA(Pro)/Cys-tRNA(Cys) deacylase
VVLDASAEQFDTVFCSGGRRGLEIELAPADLIRLAAAKVGPIAC